MSLEIVQPPEVLGFAPRIFATWEHAEENDRVVAWVFEVYVAPDILPVLESLIAAVKGTAEWRFVLPLMRTVTSSRQP